ncbi:MAG: complex I subunit 5 family protein [bacterium]
MIRIRYLVPCILMVCLVIGGTPRLASCARTSPSHAVHQEVHHEDPHHDEGGGVPYDEITPGGSVNSMIPIWLILVPLIGGILLAFLPKEQPGGNLLIALTGISFVVSLLLYNPVVKGIIKHGVLMKGIYSEIPFLPQFGFNLTFKVDPVSMSLVIFTCLIWCIVAVFSKSYLEVEERQQRYNVANCCCLAVTLGAFMAGDFFTLYIFYEGILLFLYLMIIHREDEQALTASKVYLYLGVATGLVLLYGIFLLYHMTGTVEIKSLGAALASSPAWARYVVAGMLILGFGGKAGVFLEHIWMPSSYGSAPCLTAALSSGIMIEVGAYGIFRTVNMIFSPLGMPVGDALWKWASPMLWMDTTHIGHVLIWLGIMTMFLGALNALISHHSLKLLAYSSVSQMGYIIMGIGCAAYMGSQGAMGLAGSGYHIINHAVFKVALFLCVGAVFFSTRETDIRKLGGLWRTMPLTAFVMLMSLCAISGIPGFNGFASKTMLHHAIVEAYEHSFHIMGRPDQWLKLAEWIFIVTAGCTFAYNFKLFSFIFLGKGRKEHADLAPVPASMKIALATLGTFIMFMGLFPNWLLEYFIGPMLSYFGFNAHSHAYHIIYNLHANEAPRSIIPLLYNPTTRAFLSDGAVVHNLLGGSSAILIGGVILIIGLVFGAFLYKTPEQYRVETYYRQMFRGFLSLCSFTYRTIIYAGELVVAKCMVYSWIPPLRMESVISPRGDLDDKRILDYLAALEQNKDEKTALFENISRFDQKYGEAIERALREKGLFEHISKVDEKFSKTAEKAILSKDLFTRISNVDERFSESMDKVNKGLFTRISDVDEKLSGSVDKAIGEKGVFGKVTSADSMFDGMVDKVIFSKIFWGMVARADGSILTSDFLKKFTNLEKSYDTMMEKVLFGMIGSEDLSKIKMERSDFSRSWFLNICKKVARIHTGDISNYISWIAIALTVIIVVLVGIPYLRTLFAIILAITLTILSTFILALFFL